ncbi:hypothetical protein TNCT_352851 [Trichonephila clavata]|uniref:Uncharacterized protein n=1 Tax=Trichonephila clavata TaxID=2740835 RepID=A0A8X6HN14_TRICU|nr:hypothetical protein TNCT_352851 [Trichonephila clavata]
MHTPNKYFNTILLSCHFSSNHPQTFPNPCLTTTGEKSTVIGATWPRGLDPLSIEPPDGQRRQRKVSQRLCNKGVWREGAHMVRAGSTGDKKTGQGASTKKK